VLIGLASEIGISGPPAHRWAMAGDWLPIIPFFFYSLSWAAGTLNHPAPFFVK